MWKIDQYKLDWAPLRVRRIRGAYGSLALSIKDERASPMMPGMNMMT